MAGTLEWDVDVRRLADDVRQVCLAMLMVLISNDSGQRCTHAASPSVSCGSQSDLVTGPGIGLG